MQQGGQYGEVPSYNAKPASASATGNSSTPAHTHLFNLSHEVAVAATGGLGLSSNISSISPHVATSSSHQHHAREATHPYSLGQVLQNQSLHQQPRQHYLHFQEHLSHQHHHQSLQSPSHASQQQQLVDHAAAPASSSSSPSGLQLHQPAQKQGTVPSISMGLPQHGAGVQDSQTQMQHPSMLQQQYAQHQQQHVLGLGLDQPLKVPLVAGLQEQVVRGLHQQHQQHAVVSMPQGATATAGALAVVPSSGQTSNSGLQSIAPANNLAVSCTTPAAPSTSIVVSSNLGANAGAAGLSNLPQKMGSAGAGAGGGGGNSNIKQDQAVAVAGAGQASLLGLEEVQDPLGDELDIKAGITVANRWPRQETLALLKVRSEMDSSFRDSSLKRPLWDEVSRKLAELGYHRSAKKCKEKFENVHKYYKRTKEGKAGRQDGKNYRFFSELEALYGNAGNNPARIDYGGRPSGGYLLPNSTAASARGPPDMAARTSNPSATFVRPFAADASGLNLLSDTSSSYDEDNDDEYDEPSDVAPDGKKRKRKTLSRMMAFFESLLKQVMEKQEQMQQRFLDALERREQDRMIREEAWKRQEMARMSRENDLRAQERSLAATRDAAIVAFLQKVTGQTVQLPTTTALAIAASPVQVHPPPGPLAMDASYHHHIPEDHDPFDPNSKRWPKPEVLALIKLRTSLHSRFTDPGPKGPLWEDIASAMSRLGYNRNAKRCKEKWENINKYFKKAKDSNKNRPENAKTCPYYHQLDALYKQGVLGGGTIIKALPYKTASDSLDLISVEDPMHHSAGRIGREEEFLAAVRRSSESGGIDALQPIVPLASQISTASDATASTGAPLPNTNIGPVHFYAASNPENSPAVGDIMSKDINLHRAANISPDNVSLADVNGEVQVMGTNGSPRVEPSPADDVSIQKRASLQLQHGSGEDVQRSSLSASNHGYAEQKVDLEQDARQELVEEDEAQHKQQVLLQVHVQQFQQDIRVSPAALQAAQPALATQSFIANMLQKFNNDPAESNTSTASTNQEH